MLTVYALTIPADPAQDYVFIETPLSISKIAAELGSNYQTRETNAPSVHFHESNTGNINARAAALAQLDDAAAGTRPETRRPLGTVIITNENLQKPIPEEKLKAYAFYLDFAF